MRIFPKTLLAVTLSAFACQQGLAQNASTSKLGNVHAQARTGMASHHLEARPFDSQRNAAADVDAALDRAHERGTKALIVMGANWCHDSRGLAGHFAQPDFKDVIDNRYELVYVSSGNAPGQKNLNPETALRFGLSRLEGTPTVFITNGDGMVLNQESQSFWRRADSVPADIILAYLRHYADQ